MSKLVNVVEPELTDFVSWYRDNPNNFSNWFPKVKDCGIKVPDSIIFETPDEVAKAYFMDNQVEDPKVVMNFVEKEIISKIPKTWGFLFIKNGTFSNKFDFSTCKCRNNILDITRCLIEQNYAAEMFGAGGLSEIVIREFIGDFMYKSDIPLFKIYNGMPLRPEFRVFYDFDEKKVLYSVNYWDWDYCYKAICRDFTDSIVYQAAYPEILKQFIEKKEFVEEMIIKSMQSVDLQGKWSVDIMYVKETETYYLIDMAKAENSAYWKAV